MRERQVGLALTVLVVILIIVHVVWNLTVAYHLLPEALRSNQPDLLSSNLPNLSFTLVGGLIIWKQPRNRIGWLLSLSGVIVVLLTALPFDYAGWGLFVAPGSVPAPVVPLWLQEVLTVVVFSSILTILTAIFPSGRLVRPWLRMIWLLLAIQFAAVLPGLLDAGLLDQYRVHTPLSLPALAGYSKALGPTVVHLVAFGAAFILAWGSMIWRYRESAQDERHQIKWLLAAVLLLFLAFFGSGIAPLFGASLPGNLVPILAGTVPIAIGVAILRYRLYDIDVVISRTLVYGALAAFITAVYVGIVVGIGTLIGSGSKPNLALSILATAVVAVGFQPVRERIQKVANRLVYGKRATPYEVLSEFSERVADSYAADDVLPRMAMVLAEGTGAEQATVWLRAGDQLRPAAVHPVERNGHLPIEVTGQVLPEIPAADRAVLVRHQGELLGALTVRKRPGESLTPIEEKLVDDLAHQAGLVLKNVRLTAELLQRLDDLRDSRKRLVSAQDQERRKLERNLHDGAQQNLVALKVKLGLAEMFIDRDPAKARQTLTDLKADTDEALETLRDLARGIYPPLLADKGLVAALEAQARKATVPVTVEAENIGRYPQEIEAAAYFCCLEALQNVQKYAKASSATVRLDEQDARLRFEVEDDGAGFDMATVKRGAGLTNMADRLDALDGSFTMHSQPGAGTRLIGVVALAAPVPSE